jgi:DNA-binding helix-hairpin-helix protein with protein kinase domain
MIPSPAASYHRAKNRPLVLGAPLGRGGEATVYAVGKVRRWVAKIYHQPTPARAAKLRLMLANLPDDPTDGAGHISFAWPSELVTDEQGQVAGFLMPHIDYRTSVPLFKLYNPRDRLQTWPGFTWDYLLRVAANLAGTVAALHARGYVVGDLNESNILVTNTALVTLVDCDSMQVPVSGGGTLRCTVGKAEYTPPELQGRDFAGTDRTIAHDSFGLAVLIALLLMEGVHPFQGVWRGGGAPPVVAQNIRAGNCALVAGSPLAPPPHALPSEALPPVLRLLMLRCFADGHRNPGGRPTPNEWRRALADAARGLVRCRANRQHVFGRHLSDCPWCARIRRGLPDPFPHAAALPAPPRPRPPSTARRSPRASQSGRAATGRRAAGARSGKTTAAGRARVQRGQPAGIWDRLLILFGAASTGPQPQRSARRQ